MATMVKLAQEQDEIIDEVYSRISEAEEQRSFEYHAVLRIQSWFRAQRVRRYLDHLKYSATLIQKRWRGYIGRRYAREVIKRQVFIMKLNHYNSMATKVQKTWRGFYTRKYIFNYHSRKKYLEGLKIKNEIVRNELEEFAEQQEQMAQWKQEADEKKQLDEYARKNHHLLSTEVLSGIYNSPFQPYPNEMEFHLRHARPRTPKKKPKSGHVFDPAWKTYDLPKHEPLPPLHAKPQGPFRDPREVQKQRYKLFQPTLRVATNYYSLEEARENMKAEEWVTRLNDNIFVPFSKKNIPYKSLLHTTSQYGHLSYGNEFYREEFPDEWSINKNFQSVVPPIPILEKLNDTYSQGQV